MYSPNWANSEQACTEPGKADHTERTLPDGNHAARHHRGRLARYLKEICSNGGPAMVAADRHS